MRHQKKTVKLGRTADHRKALLANQVCSLIEHHRIKTTLAKAKAVRPLAEKMVTLGKKASLHARRTALAVLRRGDAVKKLFEEIAPRAGAREGGYTRIIKLGFRKSDAARIAFIEWVDNAPGEEAVVTPESAGRAKKAKTAPEAPATAEKPKATAKPPRRPAARKSKAEVPPPKEAQ